MAKPIVGKLYTPYNKKRKDFIIEVTSVGIGSLDILSSVRYKYVKTKLNWEGEEFITDLATFKKSFKLWSEPPVKWHVVRQLASGAVVALVVVALGYWIGRVIAAGG